MAVLVRLRNSRRCTLLAAFTLLLALAWGLPRTERAAHAATSVALAIFVAKDSKVQDVKLSDLRRIFLNADDSGFSGNRTVPFNHPAHSGDRVGFDRTVLKMNPDEVSRFWIDRKIRGLPGPPRAVDSLAFLVNLVVRIPGGIAYARPAGLTEAPNFKEVRVVSVDGKLPSQPDYPIHYSE